MTSALGARMRRYALATQLNQLLLFPAMGVSDKNGDLYLTLSRQVERVLALGAGKVLTIQPSGVLRTYGAI